MSVWDVTVLRARVSWLLLKAIIGAHVRLACCRKADPDVREKLRSAARSGWAVLLGTDQ